MKNTIIFIMGPSHSGTTLLDLILGSHDLCSSLGEFDKIGEVKKCAICGCLCDTWKTFFESYRKSKKPFEAAFQAFKTPIVIDSSKNRRWVQRYNEKYPVKFIRITRDGRACLRGVVEKNGLLLRRHIKRWVSSNLHLDDFLKHKKRVHWVKYEDLCNKTDATLTNVCNFLKIEYQPKMKAFWEQQHHTLTGNAKPITMTRLYHQTITSDRLGDKIKPFIDQTGFSLKEDRRFLKVFSKSDMALFDKFGGKLNKKYGYK